MENKEKYLQAPLYLWRNFFIDSRSVIDKVFDIGIYKYADRYINYEKHKENIGKQLIYGFYRDKNFSKKIHNKIQKYANEGKIDIDTDYNGFNGETFNPEYEMEGLQKILDIDSELRVYAITYHGIKLACGFLNITVQNIDNIIISAKDILKNTPAGDPWIMVNKDRAFEFYKHKKQDFELAQFTAHIAIKSIVGKKPYCKTNKQHITARMFGYASVKNLPEILPKEIQPLFIKYSNRYWMDKVLTMLELHWGLKTYSHNMRGIYISTSKNVDMDNLAINAEKNTMKNKIAALKRQKKDAREKAIQQLNSR
jgi:hypothetical protein